MADFRIPYSTRRGGEGTLQLTQTLSRYRRTHNEAYQQSL